MPNAARLVVVIACLTTLGAMTYGLLGPGEPAGLAAGGTATPSPSADPSSVPPSPGVVSSTSAPGEPAASPMPSSAAPAPHVGIVAGHRGSDPGAVCADGTLTEAEVNFDIAQRVVEILEGLGYQVELLEEFDSRLAGYQADALVSIHADSCEPFPNATPPATGFKVASLESGSLVPEEEARLVACLTQCYAARTGMAFHENSITPHMTSYHTFFEIDGQTPGAIIETGFLLADRYMLTERADLVAQGIADGIVCFIEGGP